VKAGLEKRGPNQVLGAPGAPFQGAGLIVPQGLITSPSHAGLGKLNKDAWLVEPSSSAGLLGEATYLDAGNSRYVHGTKRS